MMWRRGHLASVACRRDDRRQSPCNLSAFVSCLCDRSSEAAVWSSVLGGLSSQLLSDVAALSQAVRRRWPPPPPWHRHLPRGPPGLLQRPEHRASQNCCSITKLTCGFWPNSPSPRATPTAPRTRTAPTLPCKHGHEGNISGETQGALFARK
eukprot:313172-Rhodomonas_salina.4